MEGTLNLTPSAVGNDRFNSILPIATLVFAPAAEILLFCPSDWTCTCEFLAASYCAFQVQLAVQVLWSAAALLTTLPNFCAKRMASHAWRFLLKVFKQACSSTVPIRIKMHMEFSILPTKLEMPIVVNYENIRVLF